MSIETQVRLSDDARKVLQRSNEVAAANGYQDVFTDHLLEALLEDRGVRGILKLYDQYAINKIPGFRQLRPSMGSMGRPVTPATPISFSDAARDILATSIRIARGVPVTAITPLILMQGALQSEYPTNSARRILETSLGPAVISSLVNARLSLEIGMKLVETLDDPTVPATLKQRVVAHINAFVRTISPNAKRQGDSPFDELDATIADPRRF